MSMPCWARALLNWPGGMLPGIPFLSMPLTIFCACSPTSGLAKAAQEPAGKEPMKSVSPAASMPPPALVLTSISTWSEAATTLASAVESLTLKPQRVVEVEHLLVDLAPGRVDQRTDVHVGVGEAVIGGVGDRVGVLARVRQRVALGGVDRRLEGPLVLAEDDEVVDHADRGAVVGVGGIVDALVGALGHGGVGGLRQLVDEGVGGIVVSALEDRADAGEVRAVVVLEEDARLLTQPRLDVVPEAHLAARLGDPRIDLVDDQGAWVADPRQVLGELLDVGLHVPFRLHRRIDEQRRVGRRQAGRVTAPAAAGAAAPGDRECRQDGAGQDERDTVSGSHRPRIVATGQTSSRGRRGHSTVTVLARFRGWSTLSSLSRAMW